MEQYVAWQGKDGDHKRAPLSLYVHLPFCVAKCTYCDFYSLAAEGEDLEGALEAGAPAPQSG